MSNAPIQDTPNAATHVVGFLFAYDRTAVVLIQKDTADKPSQAWQHGMWNGVGGKVEQGETSRQAMQREFREEALIDTGLWQFFGELRGKRHCLHFFTLDWVPGIGQARQQEKELVRWWMVEAALDLLKIGKLVPNLSWLLPMAQGREFRFSILMETDDCRRAIPDVGNESPRCSHPGCVNAPRWYAPTHCQDLVLRACNLHMVDGPRWQKL